MRAIVLSLAVFNLNALALENNSKMGKTKNTGIYKIMIAEKSSLWDSLAIEELRHYLKDMVGTEISVKVLGGAVKIAEKGNIYLGELAKQVGLIGESDIKILKSDGYVLACRDGAVGIFGDKEAGTLYGAYRFLEHLGWRYYGPYCEIVPRIKHAMNKNIYEIKNPAFEIRIIEPAFGGLYGREYNGYALTRFGFSVFASFNSNVFKNKKISVTPPVSWGVINWRRALHSDIQTHTIPTLIPQIDFDAHPEFRAKDAIGNPIPNSGHVCLSNPLLLNILKKQVDIWMTNCGSGKYFSISAADSHGWCECKECRALDPVRAKKKGAYTPFLTDRYLHCLNKVAGYVRKKHPDKIIIALAYTVATEYPPSKIKPAENVRVQLCPYTAGGALCQSHGFNCPLNKVFLNNFKGWKKIVPNQLCLFDYPMNYNNTHATIFSHDANREKLRFAYKNNVKGIWYCGVPRLLGGLFCFIQGKLLWNPNLTDSKIDALEKEYLFAYYGNAAPYIERLLVLLRSYNHDFQHPLHQGCHTSGSEYAKGDYIPKAYAIMNSAEKAVSNNPILRRRVALEKFCAVLWLDLDTCFTKNDGERYLHLAEFIRYIRNDQKKNKYISMPLTLDGHRRMLDWFRGKYFIPLDLKAEKLDVSLWYKSKSLDKLAKCLTSNDIIKYLKFNIRKNISFVRKNNSIELLLKGFKHNGPTFGPRKYNYLCSPSVSIGVLGGGKLSTDFKLGNDEIADTFLVLDGLNNDKSGKTRIRISLNGECIFSGKNQASKKGWTKLSFAVLGKLLKENNTLEIVNLEENRPNANWFLFRKAYIAPIPSTWKKLDEWPAKGNNKLDNVILWSEQGSSAKVEMDINRKSPIGNSAIKVSITGLKKSAPISTIQLWFSSSGGLKKGERYRISLFIAASREQLITLFPMANLPGWPIPSSNAKSEALVNINWVPIEIDFISDADYPSGSRVPTMFLGTTVGDQFWLADVKFKKKLKR